MASRSEDRRIRRPFIERSFRITRRGAVYLVRSFRITRRGAVYLVVMALITVSMWVFLPDYGGYGW